MTVLGTVALRPSRVVEANVEAHVELIGAAASQGVELLVFPELSLQGYPFLSQSYGPERLQAIFGSAESIHDGPNATTILECAADNDIHVVFGMHELGEKPGVIYNTAVIGGPSGLIGRYRKVHVGITEQLVWRSGSEWPVFDTAIGRVGLLICYDKMWPEACRELALGGADVLVMPTAWSVEAYGEDGSGKQLSMDQHVLFDRARAAENYRWFISSNFAGRDDGVDYIGMSQIVDPSGRVVASTPAFAPEVAVADVRIGDGIARANSFRGARLVRDRRPDTYAMTSGRVPPQVDG